MFQDKGLSRFISPLHEIAGVIAQEKTGLVITAYASNISIKKTPFFTKACQFQSGLQRFD
jgi:hypothetical protein